MIENDQSAISACDREPIHLPGAIQPHGFLVVFEEASFKVTHASANVEQFISRPVGEVLGRTIEEVFGAALVRKLGVAMGDKLFDRKAIHLKGNTQGALTTDPRMDLVAFRRDGLIFLEGERVEASQAESLLDMYAHFDPILDAMELAESSQALGRLAAAEVRRLSGFDRVMIYQFDEEWNGCVIAEDRNYELPSYLDLRFPAADIPSQARELYRTNRSRLIATSNYQPVPLVASEQYPRGSEPLDLSLSTLRSVSPVHLQYMRNMGTASSMSISIMRNDKLWGLISCHHHTPKRVGFAHRSACELLGHVFSLQIAARERGDQATRRMRRQVGLTSLLTKLSDKVDIVEALVSQSVAVMDLVNAQGFAILHNQTCTLSGTTPTEAEVRELGLWLAEKPAWDIFHTDALAHVFPRAESFSTTSRGLLAMPISRLNTTYILWFRPEVVETVSWGGDPRKTWEPSADSPTSLSPRTSFEAWKQVVRGRSSAWLDEDVEVANEFRHAVVSIVLKRAEELAALVEELSKANRELAAFSYSISHDLRTPFLHIRSYAEILREEHTVHLKSEAVGMLDRILVAAQHARKLVDSLLAFSQMGRMTMEQQAVDMGQLVTELLQTLPIDGAARKIEWAISPLPTVTGDHAQLTLVWRNLLENALKYTRMRELARIQINGQELGGFFVFRIQDNGVGFDPRYTEKLFGMFERLHRAEEFEGMGIGLANVRRIVERHGGKTWAEGALDQGATFFFSLPMKGRTSASFMLSGELG